MPTSLAFYRDVMGFEVISDAPADGRCDWVWLKSGESELMLNTAYEVEACPAAPDPARCLAHSDTFLVREAIDSLTPCQHRTRSVQAKYRSASPEERRFRLVKYAVSASSVRVQSPKGFLKRSPV
jgi:hypothetical protein